MVSFLIPVLREPVVAALKQIRKGPSGLPPLAPCGYSGIKSKHAVMEAAKVLSIQYLLYNTILCVV